MTRHGPSLAAALSAFALSGCVVVPLSSAPVPLVAYPGGGKTPAQFAQDDGACRALAAPVASQPVPSATLPQPLETAAPVQQTPESVYFSCMAAQGNVIAAAPASGAYAYAYAYPYVGFPYGSLYGGPFADEFFLNRQIGLYGGFYGGFRSGGYRGGYRR